MRAVRAPGRLSWLLAAIAVPAGVAALGVGLQAAAFSRPPRDAFVATDAVRGLLRYHVMRATEVVGRKRLAATCLQGWFRAAPGRHPEAGALVLLSNGVRLYTFGHGIHRVGVRGPASKQDAADFLLAGCPRFLASGVGTQLIGSRWVDTDPARTDGSHAVALSFDTPANRVELFLSTRTFRPLEVRLAGARGWSDLVPGGAKAAARVRRAFHLRVKAGANA